MRTDRLFRARSLLVLMAVGGLAPVVPGVLSSPAGEPLVRASAATSAELGPEDADVVERQISSDMVVDWLETPPADAAAWLAGPEAPVDHGLADELASGHDHSAHEHPDEGAEDVAAEADAGDVTHFAAASTGSGSTAGTPGNGFSVFSAAPRWLTTGYTVRFVGSDGRVEQHRDEFAAAVGTIARATGIPMRLAAGRGGAVKPSRGEITVILGAGPCGSSAPGCGGPVMTSTELVAGRVWLHRNSLTMSWANRRNLTAHELGHALGLQHHTANWSDGRQAMHPVISGLSTYRAGDVTGLRFMAGNYDPPAGRVTARSHAAGLVRVAGNLASGSRVRVTVGRSVQEVTASGGAFAAQAAVPAGVHKVCVLSLDAAPRFRRDLGCADVTAPGTPFGHFDRATNSFETIGIRGWAIDPQTADPVRVEVRRNGALVATTPADADRADIAAKYPHYGAAHGIQVAVPAVAGRNEICVRILGVGGGGNKDLGCRTVVHAVDPVGAFEAISSTELGAVVSGWALDPNTPSAVQVTLTVDGQVPAVLGSFRASAGRADVAAAHPAHGPNHGFSERLALSPGDHEICLTVVNVGLGKDQRLGCKRVHVAEVGPTGAVGSVVPGSLPAGSVPLVGGAVADTVDTVTGLAGL